MTWQEQRLDDFEAMLVEWPNTITSAVNGVAALCIKTPDVTDRVMGPSNYVPDVRATFDVKTTDWVAMKLEERKQFTCGKVTYEARRPATNDDDPIIQFQAIRSK